MASSAYLNVIVTVLLLAGSSSARKSSGKSRGDQLVYGQVLYGHPHPYARSAYSPGTAYEPFYPPKPVPYNPYISTYRSTWAPVGPPPNRVVPAYPAQQPYAQQQHHYQHQHQDSQHSAYTPVLVYNNAPPQYNSLAQYPSPAPVSYSPPAPAPAPVPYSPPAPAPAPAPYNPPTSTYSSPAPYSPPAVVPYSPPPVPYSPPAPAPAPAPYNPPTSTYSSAPYSPPAVVPYSPPLAPYDAPAIPYTPAAAIPAYPDKPAEPAYEAPVVSAPHETPVIVAPVDSTPYVAPPETPAAPPKESSYENPALKEDAIQVIENGNNNQLDDGYPWTPELVDDGLADQPIPSILFYPLDDSKPKDVLPTRYLSEDESPSDPDFAPTGKNIPDAWQEDGGFGWRV